MIKIVNLGQNCRFRTKITSFRLGNVHFLRTKIRIQEAVQSVNIVVLQLPIL